MGQVPATEVEEGAATAALPLVAPPPHFVWEYRNGLDAKSRVVMPAPYRAAFAEGGFLTVWQGECLAAMPPAQFETYVAHLTEALAHAHVERPDAVLRELRRSTYDFKLDIQGRLTLVDGLREAVGLGTEIRFLGQGSRVELWPATETDEQVAEREDLRGTISMLQLGFDVRQGS